MEFHGDRYCKDDGAIVGGIASFHGMPVTVIGQEKGKNTKDNIKRNFGMPSPDLSLIHIFSSWARAQVSLS